MDNGVEDRLGSRAFSLMGEGKTTGTIHTPDGDRRCQRVGDVSYVVCDIEGVFLRSQVMIPMVRVSARPIMWIDLNTACVQSPEIEVNISEGRGRGSNTLQNIGIFEARLAPA